MELLVRGQYVVTDANLKEDGILTDSAVLIKEGVIVDVGDYDTLKDKNPKAQIKGNGKQLLMPGIVDGHLIGNVENNMWSGGGVPFIPVPEYASTTSAMQEKISTK